MSPFHPLQTLPPPRYGLGVSDNWVAIILAVLGLSSLLIAWGGLRSGVINAGGISFRRSTQPVRYWMYLAMFPGLAAMLLLNAYHSAF